jgi:prepilin-type N-terminal cleavage/methylation domain-containing protein
MLSNKAVGPSNKQASQQGFSLIEMVVAILILTVGLLGVASAIGYALMASNSGRTVTNTKLLVVSALEQMETLRDTGNLTFGQISNAGNVDNSGADATFNGFPTGFQTVSTNPGPDGIWGTSDDLIAAGPDGLYGTADDVTDNSLAITGVTRQISITSLSATLKRIEVRVNYSARGGSTQQLIGVSYLNDDSHGNYVP